MADPQKTEIYLFGLHQGRHKYTVDHSNEIYSLENDFRLCFRPF